MGKAIADAQLKVRMDPALHEKLVAAAETRGASVNKEVNERLAASFDDGRDPDKVFASRAMFGLMKVVATAMEISGQQAAMLKSFDPKSPTPWFRDPYAFAQAEFAARAILDALRPAGSSSAPRHDDLALTSFAKSVGVSMVSVILAEMTLAQSDDSDPKSRGSRLSRDLDESMRQGLKQRLEKLGEQK
jgi:hypothetical protein